MGTGSLGVDLPHSVGGHPISCRRSRFNLFLLLDIECGGEGERGKGERREVGEEGG